MPAGSEQIRAAARRTTGGNMVQNQSGHPPRQCMSIKTEAHSAASHLLLGASQLLATAVLLPPLPQQLERPQLQGQGRVAGPGMSRRMSSGPVAVASPAEPANNQAAAGRGQPGEPRLACEAAVPSITQLPIVHRHAAGMSNALHASQVGSRPAPSSSRPAAPPPPTAGAACRCAAGMALQRCRRTAPQRTGGTIYTRTN